MLFGVDTAMKMVAAGAQSVLVAEPETGGVELGLRSDTMLTGMRSDAATGRVGGSLESTRSGTSRLWLLLERSRAFTVEGGAR